MQYIERKDYNNTISIKLVIPSGCNAHCKFCYMNNYSDVMENNKIKFLSNFIYSLDTVINKINNKNPISLDITGNEPTFDPELLKIVLLKLKEYNIQGKVSRVTMTTNGYRLKECIPYLKNVVNYINISIHDFSFEERVEIMKSTLIDKDYKDLITQLNKIGIVVSAISVIYKEISNFIKWRDDFISWCKDKGFISLRFRCDVFWNNNYCFDYYMQQSVDDHNYICINHENTPDFHWCRLRRNDGFRVFFLKGVLNTSLVTKGIEYIVADDGLAYCDYYKETRLEDYKYEIGKIYDLTV